MTVFVLTPEKELYNGTATSVKVPGVVGQFQILRGHAPIVSALSKGDVHITTESGEKQVYKIAKGFVEVFNDEVSVLIREQKEED